MSLDPRTPVLVGAAAVSQRLDDPLAARPAWALMADALDAAAQDAGSRALLDQADSIRVPRGFWAYADPGRRVAGALGAKRARTELVELGILQQTLLSDACRAIAAGEETIALVTGGEAKHRDVRAAKAGIELPDVDPDDAAPDRHREPAEAIFHPLELERGLVLPVRAFAVLDSALRAAEGQGLAAHQDEIARLWAEGGRIAERNPHAWRPRPASFDELRHGSPANPMLAFPYRRWHASEWNVDQAAGLILCSLARARALGLPEQGWIFPLAASEANHVVPVTARPDLHRSPGARIAGERVLGLAGRRLEDVDALEVYSCFPAAVRIFQRELGLPSERPFTVTGGMAAAGGPLNNFVLQATVRMAEVLRARPGSTGLVTSVSGFLNKLGYGLWASAAPEAPFAFADVTAEVAAGTPAREIVAEAREPVRIVGYTVMHLGDAPSEALCVCELPDGRRTLATTRDRSLLADMVREEFCGRAIRLDAQGRFDGAARV